MNKFKVSFKITGLEFQVEGSRDDVGLITNSIGQQFKGLMEPISSAIEPDENKSQLVITEDGKINEFKPKRRKKRTNSVKKEDEPNPIDFKNDTVKLWLALTSLENAG